MNFSTGIKTKAQALSTIAAITPDVSDEVLAKQVKDQKAYSIRENQLAADAKALAAQMISQLPESVQIVNAEIRTSAGPTELISIRIVKH